MKTKRHVIEGTWSGYRPSQERVCHREVVTDLKLIEWCQKTHAIRYTDGTLLYLTVRPCKPRERVKPNRQYHELIRECAAKGVTSVAALHGI